VNIEFHIQTIKVNGIESSSAFSVGTNLLFGFRSQSKTANGNGSLTGDHGELASLMSAIDDRDSVDTPSWQLGSGADTASAFGPMPGGALVEE
jgi:hypothetical protein